MALYKRKRAAISETTASETAAPETPAPSSPVQAGLSNGARPTWKLSRLIERARDAAPALESKDVEPELAHARLADMYRDVELDPPNAADVERLLRPLDAESLRRLALALAMLDDLKLRAVLPELARRAPIASQVKDGLFELARDVPPLTVALVAQSATRAEEFSRRFAARLGVGIAGETEAASRERLIALDYTRLLNEAERAKAAATEAMKRLRDEQSESDRLRRPRGKF